MRGVAAIGVVVFHAWLYTMDEPDAGARSSLSDFLYHELRLGLIMFFALSGFVLFRPWVRAILDGRRKPDLRRYAHARIARILPAYYLAIAASVILLWNLEGTPGVRLPDAGDLWLFLVLAQNFSGETVMSLNAPTWSLAVEALFYMLLPVLGWFAFRLPARRAALLAIPGAMIVAGLAYTWFVQEQGLPLTWRKNLPGLLPYFGIGMAAAILVHGRQFTAERASAMIVGGFGLVLLDALVQSLHGGGIVEVPYATIWRDLPAAIGFGVMIAAVSARPRSRALGSPPLVALGTISYGIYLWHMPLMLWARGNDMLPSHPLVASAVVVPAAIAIATVSWFLVEKPAIDRVAARRQRSRSALSRSREAFASRSGTPPVSARDAAAPTNPPGALNSFS